MKTAKIDKSLLRYLPPVEALLNSEVGVAASAQLEHRLLADCAREAVEAVRTEILDGKNFDGSREEIQQRTLQVYQSRIDELLVPSLQKVINCTGVILHTNLGRAVFSEDPIHLAGQIMTGYCNLEYDLESGRRGDRTRHVEELLCKLTGAEAACVVNNNAAAVLIALNTLANRKEVIISRGELIEIGGSFRIPDVMAKSGAKMVEVGTTNKTHLKDFANAISSRTAGVLHVHTSNYRIQGFTAAVALEDLVQLAHENDLFVLHDLGGGILVDLRQFQLPYEPVVRESIEAGVDVVTFSGDKVLGGPQSGILVGKQALIHKIKRNPLMRALRCDKLTYAILEATLRIFLNPEELPQKHRVFQMFLQPVENLKARGEAILQKLRNLDTPYTLALSESQAQPGSGTLPLTQLPSLAITIRPARGNIHTLARRLRTGDPPVVGYTQKNTLYLDLRTVLPEEIDLLAGALARALQV